AVRPLLPGTRVPAAGYVRGRSKLSAEGAQGRARPDRGPLRAGPRLLVLGRPGAGAADVGGGVQGEQVQSLGQEVPGDAGAGAAGPGAAAHLTLLLLLLAQGPAPAPAPAPGPGPGAVLVGRVTAVAWPSQQGLATALAEAADRAPPFPGVGPLPSRPIRVILAPTRDRFDSLTRGRLPRWSE